MNKFAKLLISAAVASAFATSAQADLISINTPNGVVNNITSFDFGPAVVLAQNGNQAFVDLLNETGPFEATAVSASIFGTGINVFGHGRITGLTGGSVPNAARLYNEQTLGGALDTANRFELVYQFAYREVLYSGTPEIDGSQTAKFAFAADQKTADGFNYFKIFVKDLDVDAASNYADGTGFDTGKLVFEGEVRHVSSTLSDFSADPAPSGGFASLGKDSDDVLNGVSDLSSKKTITGSGKTAAFDLLKAVPTVYDTDFWKVSLTEFLLQNVGQQLPFGSVDPSEMVAGNVANIGNVNGLSCDTNGAAPGGWSINCDDVTTTFVESGGADIIFQTDFNASVRGVPEPGTLALAGLALGALSLARRRKA